MPRLGGNDFDEDDLPFNEDTEELESDRVKLELDADLLSDGESVLSCDDCRWIFDLSWPSMMHKN